MIIDYKFRKARKVHECSECHRLIQPGSIYLDLYGMASEGDKPYHLKLCSKHNEIWIKYGWRNTRYLFAIKKVLTYYKYKKLIEYLNDTAFIIIGIVRKNKVLGKWQEENYWFKGVYITQSCGYSGDEYSGTIFIPITEKHFLNFYYEC